MAWTLVISTMIEYGPTEVRVHPDGGYYLVDVLVMLKMVPSRSAARRLIQEGAVTIKHEECACER